MPMGRAFLVRMAWLGGAALAGAGATFLAADRIGRAEAAATRIELGACGIAPGPPTMTVPLKPVLHGLAPAEMSLGPFALAGMAEPLVIGFHLVDDPAEKVAVRQSGRVDLPVLAEGAGRLEKIALRCRYGEPARVIYTYARQRLDLDVVPGESPKADHPS